MALIDGAQRIAATNPAESFLVQAPAGSGKTEILTQRFLRLLSTVAAPEHIIALTFTRKAASEMRERIIVALQSAQANMTPTTPHQIMTLGFATQALAQSNALQWDLLHQPHRLKIITIDSLCHSINQAIPISEQQIAYPNITDKANRHYQNAAKNCIQFASATQEYQEALKTLLLHVDNKHERLVHLFQELLAQRDQWLFALFQARLQEKSTFEEALRFIEHHELTRFKALLPPSLAQKITELTRELSQIEQDPASPRYALRDWINFEQINAPIIKALCKTLLTGDTFRKSFDHHVGLKKGLCPDTTFYSLKQASKELLAELNDYPDFLQSLIHVNQLPKPEYDLEQWDVLQALFTLLPVLVGHLHVIFSEHNEVDFTSISQHALQALGDADNPTDLALYLDNAIHHLLIDEFQDTSISQFELIGRLVQGWQVQDGKTLFIVGDPMQSIYKFRQAEVGLFFRAKEYGIGAIPLHFLQLRCNFRATQTLIHWANTHFSGIFPKHVDIESGAVSFHPSVPVIQESESSAIHALSFESKEAEAEYLIHAIQYELQAHPEQNIAILVRSRSQLKPIINALRQQQIEYQGTDIDLLANLEHLRDAWSLTIALLFPGNRLAWLSLLRSPYCGLSLQDILSIAQYNKKRSIYEALLQLDTISELSKDGYLRAQFLIQVMQKALSERYHYSLANWVIATLKALHCDQILTTSQRHDLDQFWMLLDRLEQEGRISDMQEFIQEFNRLYSKQAKPSRLQIMTIHKSKGLEFDTVFLPGLGAQPNVSSNPMLRWLKLPTHNSDNLLLVSPIQSAHRPDCPLYDYLGRLDDEKNQYEAQRLLYVATTRAKSRLYLLDSSSKSNKKSLRSMLKCQEFIEQESIHTSEEIHSTPTNLMKLSSDFYLTSPTFVTQPLNATTPKLRTSIARLTGIVAHRMLQWICDNHPPTYADIPWNLAHDALKQLGFDTRMQHNSMDTLQHQMLQLFNDAEGLWIIATHKNEHNEYELLVRLQDTVVTRIIDRTFEDNGRLWIIDFKTGADDFKANREHRKQLNEYGLYLSHTTNLPISCGIYYLTNNHWLHWNYEKLYELSVQ